MLKLPYSAEQRHPRARKFKIPRDQGLINYDRSRILMSDESLVHWSSDEVNCLVRNLKNNIGQDLGFSPLDLDPDVEER
jgi:hypothetical protein